MASENTTQPVCTYPRPPPAAAPTALKYIRITRGHAKISVSTAPPHQTSGRHQQLRCPGSESRRRHRVVTGTKRGFITPYTAKLQHGGASAQPNALYRLKPGCDTQAFFYFMLAPILNTLLRRCHSQGGCSQGPLMVCCNSCKVLCNFCTL